MKRLIFFLTVSVIMTQCANTEKNKKIESFSGWWIYGQGEHIFKDEKSLSEFQIVFLEEENDIELLYLSITEMEYFPMECIMKGYVDNNILKVIDFEITYIQGCGQELE